jgi:hypothetical protein
VHPECVHEADDAGEPFAEQLDHLPHLVLGRLVGVDATEGGAERLRVEEAVDRRLDDALLVAERAEDRALRDSGSIRDLARRDVASAFPDQRDDGVDDRAAAFFGRERARPLSRHGGDDKEAARKSHPPILSE